jgi:hypothetical protein
LSAAVIPLLGVEVIGDDAKLESRLGMMAAPLFFPSTTFDPFTMKPLAVSRCPFTNWFPEFQPPIDRAVTDSCRSSVQVEV